MIIGDLFLKKKIDDARNHRQYITPVDGGYLVYTARASHILCYIYNELIFKIPTHFARVHGISVINYPKIRYLCGDQEEAYRQAQDKNNEIGISKFIESTADTARANSKDAYVKVDPFYIGLHKVEKGKDRGEVFYIYEYTKNKRVVGKRFHISDRLFYETRDKAKEAVEKFEENLIANGEINKQG